MKPPQYWRQNKDWSNWIGKRGKVVATTVVRVAAPERAAFAPYSYALVDFQGEPKEIMGVGNEVLSVGDTVECVLRKVAASAPHELIQYGMKVKKVGE